MSQTALINKYRPVAFEEVLGNELAVKALKDALASPSRPHSYLAVGPSGTGKTTLARIIAKELDANILEIDAASHSGVDDMRELTQLAGFKPVMVQQNRMYIIDECHSLSKAAWQSLLKLIEQPPEFLYIALCTTEASKVIETIKTRCYPITLKPLKVQEIEELVQTVSELEGWKLADDVFNAIVLAANGSPRRALTFLQAGHLAQNKNELSQIISQVDTDSSPGVEICKLLLKGSKNWRAYAQLLEKVENDEDEFASIQRYLLAVMSRSEDTQARAAWMFLERLVAPRSTYDKKVHLAVAVGEVALAEPF